MEIPPEKQFHFHDGTSVADLEGLKKKIERISYDEFYSHVNDEKNDFANWVEHVLGKKALAEKLRSVTSIVETVEILNEELYPEKSEEHMHELAEEGGVDLQERIEEELFHTPAEPDATPVEAPPEVNTEPSSPDNETSAEPEVHTGSHETTNGQDEVSLPPREEVEGVKLPRAPVTTLKAPHTPITEKVGKPVTQEEHMRFVVKQFLYGFVLGVIIGFILAKMIELV